MSPDDIVEFLKSHPDFFVDRPELLATLEIPHECGAATSLLEYQVRRLRKDNRHLNSKMRDLIQIARDNDVLNERMHRLTMEIMQCRSLEELVPCIQEVIRDKFGIDIVRFRLKHHGEGLESLGYVAPSDERWALFTDLQESGRINLGVLTEHEIQFVFGEEKDRVRSSALLPLKRGQEIGVLGLGSFSPDRFGRQMGTVFLQQMASMISAAIELLDAPSGQPGVTSTG